MMKDEWEYELHDLTRSLVALEHVICNATALRPTALMLPVSFERYAPGANPTIYGHPVVFGDRAALLYVPVDLGGRGVCDGP